MSERKIDKKKESSKDKTFPISYVLSDIKENISISTISNTQTYKEQIINQAIKHNSQGNILEAAKYYQLFINKGFKDYRVFSNYGSVLKSLGKLKEAEASTRKSIELKPDFAVAHSNLGGILKDLGKLKEAEVSTRKAIQFKPDYAMAHCNLGSILSELGKLKEAEVSTRKAIQFKPNLANAHSNLGNILRDLGSIDEAISSYQEAINIDKNLDYALKEIGQLLLKKGNHASGIVKLRESIGSIIFNPKKSSITIY